MIDKNKLSPLKRYPCACCGYLTCFDISHSSYDICEVCGWEDDPVQFEDKDYCGGANHISLKQARLNFKNFGSSRKECLNYCRPPLPEELPDSLP